MLCVVLLSTSKESVALRWLPTNSQSEDVNFNVMVSDHHNIIHNIGDVSFPRSDTTNSQVKNRRLSSVMKFRECTFSKTTTLCLMLTKQHLAKTYWFRNKNSMCSAMEGITDCMTECLCKEEYYWRNLMREGRKSLAARGVFSCNPTCDATASKKNYTCKTSESNPYGSSYCCATTGSGCVQGLSLTAGSGGYVPTVTRSDFNCSSTTEPWSQSKQHWCCIHKGVMCTSTQQSSEWYNCTTSDGWTEEKKSWCCYFRSYCTTAPTTTTTTTSSTTASQSTTGSDSGSGSGDVPPCVVQCMQQTSECAQV